MYKYVNEQERLPQNVIRRETLGRVNGLDLGDIEIEKSFSRYLDDLMLKYGFETDPEVYREAYIDPSTWSKWRKYGKKITYPNKGFVAAIAVAMRLELYETEELMRRAGHAFNPGETWDLIIMRCIEKRVYDFDIINEMLADRDLKTIGPAAIDSKKEKEEKKKAEARRKEEQETKKRKIRKSGMQFQGKG